MTELANIKFDVIINCGAVLARTVATEELPSSGAGKVETIAPTGALTS